MLQRASPSSGTGDENTQYDLPTISGLSVQIPLGHYMNSCFRPYWRKPGSDEYICNICEPRRASLLPGYLLFCHASGIAVYGKEHDKASACVLAWHCPTPDSAREQSPDLFC